jgi:hypothetical protein
MESALKTLQHHGITLRAEYNFQKEPLEPMNLDVQTNLSTSDTEINLLSETTPSNSSLFQPLSANEDNPTMEPQIPVTESSFYFPTLISQPAKTWEAAAKRSDLTDFDKELSKRYKNLLNLTESSNQVKKLPIYISSYKRASDHLKDIFIKRLVCPSL